MSEWKDIASAPKDGTIILLGTYVEAFDKVVNFFWQEMGYWEKIGRKRGYWALSATGDKITESFTHWHPLPAPPGSTESRAVDP